MTENSYIYSQADMPHTPGRREVREIDGDPDAIAAHAADIAALGEKMARAARTLELFADGTVGKGESFEAIREQAKEVHSDLSTAAKRYLPSGETLAAYSNKLRTAQGETGWRVSGAERTWEEVRAASQVLGEASGAKREWEWNESHDVEQTGTAPTDHAEQGAFDAAVENWEYYWGSYDAPVETWESAYETACSGLEKVNADGVSDSFWDNSMPFVEAMLTVLLYVGIALMVVAFFVTGPLALLAGVLAAVAGVLSLLGEIAKLNAGRGDWTSVALAAIGIIPFGKLAKFASFVNPGKFPKVAAVFRIAGDDFAQYGSKLDEFVGGKVKNLFDVVGKNGEILVRSPHGLNSQNLMRMLYTPKFLVQNFGWTGGGRAGWEALLGNPATTAEAFGGGVDLYVKVVSTLKDLKEKFD
ncbi:hypothetical protein DY023_04190 [Microbacterium bovistercoris]|uniref:Uncharacterized protein n=1 Tax=Microbacterium bovistercoris TaxID=2293570 RepID=A0A371NXS3_9MICO|nr:hypothetical protein [Microbacterium bovistercoris]REJ07203.1 hypothetical protein DY023_04190 [Microbacterium bovistercoris]